MATVPLHLPRMNEWRCLADGHDVLQRVNVTSRGGKGSLQRREIRDSILLTMTPRSELHHITSAA